MAVIKYSALVDQLRGKLNGTVFSKFKNGFNTYKKGQPSRVGSKAQQRRRQFMQQIAGAWNGLTPTQRTGWTTASALRPQTNRLGDPVVLSGYNFFQHINMYCLLANRPIQLGASTINTQPEVKEILSAVLDTTVTDSGYQLNTFSIEQAFLSGDAQNYWTLFYISGPFRNADLKYQNTYWYAGQMTQTIAWNRATPITSTFSNVIMPEGWSTWDGAWHYIQLVSFRPNRQWVSDPVYFLVQSNFTPPPPPLLDIEIIPNGSGEDIIVWFSSSGGIADVSAGYNLVRSTAPLAGTAADYWTEWIMSETFDPSPTPIPASVDTGRPIVQSQLALIGSGSTPSLYLTPQFEWYDWINTNNPVPTSAQSNYYTFKARIIRKADNATSPWGYYTLRATGA